MDRSAALLNDPAKTDYTYIAQLPYLRIAVDELMESLEESNIALTNQSEEYIVVPIGVDKIIPIEWDVNYPGFPKLPTDLIEIQEVLERTNGTDNLFVPLVKKESITAFPINNSFMIWAWTDNCIYFNPNGANTVREIQLKYISDYEMNIVNSTDFVYVINARSFLSYKTAALCAQFIGENESRAQLLDEKAERALERLENISNKGRQQIMTRHRPFRAGYKARGGH
jgi:hypothetical protein